MILYELAKMDGAILLDRTGTHIIHANVQLMPDASIESQETGTRHRTAERVAKQLDALAISISAARDVVTIYVGDIRYIMDPIRVILSKADQALQTLERFKSRLNQVATSLSALEFQDAVTLFDVTSVLQRTEMVLALVAPDRALHHRAGHRGPAGAAPDGGAAGQRARGPGGGAGRLPARCLRRPGWRRPGRR